MSDIDLSEPFRKRPHDESADDGDELEAHHMNDTYQSACIAALERARAEIQAIYNDTSSLRHEEFYRGLVEARDAVTRLLETKP